MLNGLQSKQAGKTRPPPRYSMAVETFGERTFHNPVLSGRSRSSPPGGEEGEGEEVAARLG